MAHLKVRPFRIPRVYRAKNLRALCASVVNSLF
jgi:hypothetical protein